MGNAFYPDEWLDSAYDIPYEQFYQKGMRGIIFDIDNTPVPHGAPADERALDDVCRGSALYGCVRGEADRHLFDSCKADQSEGRDPDRVKAESGENCPVVLCEKTGKK